MTERKYQLPPNLDPPDPLQEVEALKHVVKELTAKVQHLVVFIDSQGLLENHSYIFPDGDVWKAQDIE